MPAIVDIEKCTGCGTCAEVCPNEAITVQDAAHVDAQACGECGACVQACPEEALRLVFTAELVEESLPSVPYTAQARRGFPVPVDRQPPMDTEPSRLTQVLKALRQVSEVAGPWVVSLLESRRTVPSTREEQPPAVPGSQPPRSCSPSPPGPVPRPVRPLRRRHRGRRS